jgi:hypothetical protein
MPTRRINQPVDPVTIAPSCRDADHMPRTDVVRIPGQYEHTCRACGRGFKFTVRAETRLG